MRFLIALCLCSASLLADDEIFRGSPTVRLFAYPDKEEREKLDSATAKKNECVIVQRGRNYFWASRDNAPLTRVDAPQFTYFIHKGGAGYVKILTGSRKAMNAPVDYIEHFSRGFEVITYWGVVQSNSVPPAP